MSTFVHFIDVGQGNMVLIQASSGGNFLFDCNVTNDNELRVLNYLSDYIPDNSSIRAFICSHRDADHIRGIEKVHAAYPICSIWDSGFPGTTKDSSEYTTYMRLRRQVGSKVIQRNTSNCFGTTKISYLSAQDERLPKDANSQGIVLKVEDVSVGLGLTNGSAMLTGDGDGETWCNAILKDYTANELKSDILMAGHHGSKTFFEGPISSAFGSDKYTQHLEAIKPDMCVISVGRNGFGHPDKNALEHYESYCEGALTDEKIVRTDLHGSIKLELGHISALGGGWKMTTYRRGLFSKPLNLRKNFSDSLL